ncbi:DUF6344 domain-containing protein [Streptomyces sp. NPDC003401]
MTDNRITKLWTAFITAFLALCTALGLVTTSATTAVAQSEPTRNSGESSSTVPANVPAVTPRTSWLPTRSLPPTMKQRIHAEAHGKSPNCRRSPLPETEPDDLTTPCDTVTDLTTELTAPALRS